MPPNEAETEGALVWQWDAVADGAGANMVTCLRLLERASATANVACGGAALMAALLTCVWGGCLFIPGREMNKKKIKKCLCLGWPPASNSHTTTNQNHAHLMQEVTVRRFNR